MDECSEKWIAKIIRAQFSFDSFVSKVVGRHVGGYFK